MSTQNPAKIVMRDVHKSFGPKVVLDGLDLEVGQGESVVVIGGSGTGKSVMLKCVLGLLHPEQGSIKVDGEEVVGMRGKERDRVLEKFGMLFQSAALFDSLKVWENVAFGLIQGRGMSRDDAKGVALTKMAQVGLGEDVGELSPAELSGGMQKRVGLARAIATDPEILLLDEPTAGLDPITSNKINDLILETVDALGVTVLSVNSDMVGAKRLSHRIAMLHDGHIIWTGPSENMFESENEYVDQFVNSRSQGPISTIVFAAG